MTQAKLCPRREICGILIIRINALRWRRRTLDQRVRHNHRASGRYLCAIVFLDALHDAQGVVWKFHGRLLLQGGIVIGGTDPTIHRIGSPSVQLGIVPRTLSIAWIHGFKFGPHESFSALREISLSARHGARCSSTVVSMGRCIFWRRLDDGWGCWKVGDIVASALKPFISAFLDTRVIDLPQPLRVIDIKLHPGCDLVRT